MAGKYIPDGAKITCPLCSKPEGTLKVTSNDIKLQGKPWATIADKGKQNLAFQGNCMKFSNNPPPCAGVISPSEWQVPAQGVSINGNAPLLEGSSIMCTTGGVPITISQHGQKSIPTNLGKLAQTGVPAPLPEEEDKPKVLDAYWIDRNQTKIKLLPYGENKLYLYIIFNKYSIGKKYKIEVYELDSIADDLIFSTKELIVKWEKTVISLELTKDKFNKGGDSVQYLYFKVRLEDDESKKFPFSEEDYLKIHLIRYIPEIMRSLNPPWETAAKLQEKWFLGEVNDKPWTKDPEINFLNLDWIISYERAKKIYDEIIANGGYLKDREAIDSLKTEIRDMYKDGFITLPDKVNNEKPFGTFSVKIVIKRNVVKKINGKRIIVDEKMPLIEKYYYKDKQYGIKKGWMSGDMNFEPLDDLFGTLANYNFRIAASGVLTFLKEGIFQVNVKQIAIYVKDSFDFIDTNQELGAWDPETNDINVWNPEYYRVTNESYRNWRADHNKGGDFYLYSTIRIFNVKNNYSFEMTIP